MMRIGHGYDAHRFVVNKTLRLGGVNIPSVFGLLAHSDGDVLIHALCDALLGALALPDIGQQFSDQDAAYKNIDSRILLRHVRDLLFAQGYTVSNADTTLIAQQPKLAPHIHSMRETLADDLGISIAQINVKATTTEKMGFTGRAEGIAAHAVVLLQQEASV